MLCVMGAALASGIAHAQIMKTARAELTDKTESLSIGSNIYITPDPHNSQTAQSVITRHKNNLRGERVDQDVLNLQKDHTGFWLLFSVTNSSQYEDWVLSLGGPFDGRYSYGSEYTVQTDEGLSFTGTPEKPLSEIHQFFAKKGNVSLKIPSGHSTLFAVYFKTAGGYPQTITPSLIRLDTYYKQMQATPWRLAGSMLITLGLACFFMAVAYLQKNRGYLLFSVYYVLFAILLYTAHTTLITSIPLVEAFNTLVIVAISLSAIAMTHFFLNLGEQHNNENKLLIGLVAIIVLSALGSSVMLPTGSLWRSTLIALPITGTLLSLAYIAFMQGQSGRYAGHYLASGFLIGAIGFGISGLAAMNYLSAGPINVNLYWLLLIPQAVFFITGCNKKIATHQEEQRTAIARESRAAQSLAKLKQSKESADQTRLLRVIERERELMAELREREMQQTDEMRKAKELADAANRAKSAFLAVVSHEIRTPMTGIIGVLRLLKETKISKEQAEYILTIQKSGDAMMGLLNDILDFEKIETGNMQLESIDFDLPKLVQGVVTLMSGHAADKNIYLQYEIADDFPRVVVGDPTRLRQVLLNLVSNALKFTRKGGVTLRLKATPVKHLPENIKGDYEIYFAVEDTGIGISPEAQETLFNPFHQADQSVARKYGGSGLGLAICQRLVETMGGAIRLNSEINKGSTFFFSLLMQKGQEDNLDKTDSQGQNFTHAITPPLRILVIEDNEINRKVLQNFLEKDKHKVTLCDRGENAIDQLEKSTFDVIFTDIKLPGISGLETARTIRTLPNRKIASIPIIAITGNVSPEDIRACYDSGINDFIGKPIDYDKLLRTLADVHSGKFNAPTIQPLTKQEVPLGSFIESIDPQFDTPPIHQFISKISTPDETVPVWQNSQILDLLLVDGLLKSLGMKAVSELMSGFMIKNEEITKALLNLKQAPNLNEIYERAHELKGMASNFGLKELSALSAVIEKAAEQKDLIKTVDSLTDIDKASERANQAIQEWLVARQSSN